MSHLMNDTKSRLMNASKVDKKNTSVKNGQKVDLYKARPSLLKHVKTNVLKEVDHWRQLFLEVTHTSIPE